MYIPDHYSEAELKLAEYFGFKNLIENNDVEPLTLYRMMAHHAFMKDDRTEYAAAVRRVISAIDSRNPLRHTPEFENLIKIA